MSDGMADDARAKLYWEDIRPGLSIETPAYGASADEMLRFARTFNPQPIHADPEMAGEMLYGGLIASGWHTCALTMRALVDHFLSRTASLGSPGVEVVRWLKPNRPGDRLRLRLTCVAAEPSKSRPDMGRCRFRHTVVNQEEATVMEMEGWLLFARRPSAATETKD
jgi:acyl dehydratase